MSSVKCPNCSTKVDEQHKSCPHCGRRLSGKRGKAKAKLNPSPDPGASGSLPPSSKSTKVEIEEPEIELSVPAAPGPVEEEPFLEIDPVESVEIDAAESELPSPARIRALIAEDLGLIESGLEIYTDKKGKPVGVSYPTEVGAIDILARDSQGSLVVILVADPGDEAELATGVLQRMGWAKKHLDAGKKPVRGLILAESVPDSLLYAASALPASVGIRTYRMALCFDVVET